MINIVVNNGIRLVFLVFLQVLVLNNIQLGGYVNPQLYVLFLLWLPFETPKSLTLLLALLLGFCIDIFTGTLGMHTAASVFMAYCRPYILNLISPRDGYELSMRPNVQSLGLIWFLSYASVLILLHHLFLFYVEAFRLSEFFHTLIRAIFSTTFTMLLVVLAQFLTYRQKPLT
ncbi:MAG: rod shape-determining protein MreD [Flavobacteriales bacterium]|nr:rod shape-determining protein MreD [Bacteroidales bacterium AH-315-I05]PCJ82999.1 MAG: rod shape-determining protein MreD [Flavobacteriales bacterium]